MSRPCNGAQAIVNLPRKIRIGPFDFTIQKWSANQSLASPRYGECSTTELRISISTGFASSLKAADTFLHEVLHAIFWAYGIEDGDKEERKVNMLATAWVQVYRDNPWLLDWLKRCLIPHE